MFSVDLLDRGSFDGAGVRTILRDRRGGGGRVCRLWTDDGRHDGKDSLEVRPWTIRARRDLQWSPAATVPCKTDSDSLIRWVGLSTGKTTAVNRPGRVFTIIELQALGIVGFGLQNHYMWADGKIIKARQVRSNFASNLIQVFAIKSIRSSGGIADGSGTVAPDVPNSFAINHFGRPGWVRPFPKTFSSF